MMVSKSWGGVEEESYNLVGSELQFGKMKRFWRWLVVTVTQQYECTQCHPTVYLKIAKMANFMLCVSYHNAKVCLDGGGRGRIQGIFKIESLYLQEHFSYPVLEDGKYCTLCPCSSVKINSILTKLSLGT